MSPVADEIGRYIREARLGRPAVLGHSLGGSIALVLATRHPDVMGRVMVIDTMPFVGLAFGPPGSTADTIRPIADGMRARLLEQPLDSPANLFQQMIEGMTGSARLRATLREYARDSDPQVLANAFHESLGTDLRPELARVSAPIAVLYVYPQGLKMSLEQFDETVRQSFSNASTVRLVRVDGSRHYIQFDQPARLVAEVDAFMRR